MKPAKTLPLPLITQAKLSPTPTCKDLCLSVKMYHFNKNSLTPNYNIPISQGSGTVCLYFRAL